MKNFTLFFCLIAFGQIQAQTWDGSDGTDWNTPANWSGNAVPLIGGSVTIPNTANKPVLAANTTIASLTMSAGSAIDFKGFTLIVSGSFNIQGATLNNTNAGADIVLTTNGAATNYFGGNTINDNITINQTAAGILYEGYSNSDIFNGNTTINITGTGTSYTCYSAKSSFNGNLAITRSTVGATSILNAGFNALTGNLSYTNNAGGASSINPSGIVSGTIGGTINITAGGAGNPAFEMRRITNLTTGGTISVQNSGTVGITDDTLKLVALNVNGFTTSGSDEMRRNSITGNVSFSEAVTNAGTVYIGGNIITGTTSYGSTTAATWYEGYTEASTNNGNTTIDITGTGTFYTCYHQKTTFNGNLTVTRTSAGGTALFNNGFAALTGNFSYTNNAGGASSINPNGVASGAIGGTVNITAGGAGNPPFEMRRITNLTTGGTISVQNSGTVGITDDTLKLVALNVNGFTTSGSDEMRRNSITGNVSFSEAATNAGTVYIGGNIITGNTSYSSNTAATWYESYTNSDTYNGNVAFNKSGAGTMSIAYNDTSYVNQNIVFNAAAGIDINTALNFGGNTSATIEQLGTQPIIMPGLIMEKTGGANLALNDSVTIATKGTFISGNIVSSGLNRLIFSDNAIQSGASDNSHVIGPVIKIGNDAFTFPIGSISAMQSVAMTAPVGATTRFRAEYFPMSPHPTYDTSKRAVGLAGISGCEYWKVDREVGTTNVILTFDFGGPCLCVEQPANLRVARWSGAQWTDLGNGGFTGGLSDGTVQTAAGVADYGVFTLGSSALVGPSVSIARNVANPVCICRKVTFTATPAAAGCGPSYQWKKNGANVGTNSAIYSDSTLVNGDVISVVITSSAAFASPPTATSTNTFSITTTDLNTWTGTTSNNWHLASNWSCQSIPCELSKVTVNPAPNPCEILSGQVKVISLTANDGSVFRALNGSTLQLK